VGGGHGPGGVAEGAVGDEEELGAAGEQGGGRQGAGEAGEGGVGGVGEWRGGVG
jgi:hypothetical protein